MPIFVGKKEYKPLLAVPAVTPPRTDDGVRSIHFADTLVWVDTDYFYVESLENTLPTDDPDHSEFLIKARIVAPTGTEAPAKVFYAIDKIEPTAWTEITADIQLEAGKTISAEEGQKVYIYSENPVLTKDVHITCSNEKNYRRVGGTKGLLSDDKIIID